MSEHREYAVPSEEVVTADVIGANCPHCEDEMIVVTERPSVGDCPRCGHSAFVEVPR